MTDTQPMAPTDAELFVVAREAGLLPDNSHPAPETRAARKHSNAVQAFARAVLAKWGTPPAVAPWRSAVLDLIDECPGLTMEQDQWLSRRVKELDFASTPQPTQAQAVAVPLTDSAARSLVWSASDWARSESINEDDVLEIVRATEAAHGIKGGQHE